jgi:rSAM/selenodomain-associated transferase 1
MKRGLVIMAKVPAPGRVKTRLQPVLTPEESASLAHAMLEDAIAKSASIDAGLIVAFAPSDEQGYFRRFESYDFTLFAQFGETLGDRICSAFEFAFSEGLDSVVMIGTDSPTFPAAFLDNAFAELEKADAVLGPTEDGGYYLIGLNSVRDVLFAGVEWSSANTFRQTDSNLKNAGLVVSHLAPWYDVDEPDDLIRLRDDSFTEANSPATFKLLKR